MLAYRRSKFILIFGFFLLTPFISAPTSANETTKAEKSSSPDATLKFGIGPGPSGESGDQVDNQHAAVRLGLELKSEDEFKEYIEEDDKEYFEDTPDPYENFNRSMFKFNDFLYEKVMEPVATVYSEITDEDMRGIVQSFFKNVTMPVRLVSSVFQGNGEKAGRTLARFFINSTLGIGGMVDVAKSEFGIAEVKEDFDQALAANNVKTGPYFVWPVIGPSTLRGTFSKAIDGLLDPMWIIAPGAGADFGIGAGRKINDTAISLHVKEEIDEMAIDPYLSVRDLYLQYRKGLEKK